MLSGDGELEMEIETRFPMFGGWQTQFYIGYSIPTGDPFAFATATATTIATTAATTIATVTATAI